MPFSQQHGVQLAFSDLFSVFGVVRGMWFGEFKQFGQWISIPEVPGTLVVSNEDSTNSGITTYETVAEFRVPYADADNTEELNQFAKSDGVVLRYTSGGGKQRLVGSKAYPLKFTFSESDSFDGYVCRLSGTGLVPTCFIN